MARSDTKPPQAKAARYREILATLARHGIGVLGEQFTEHGPERQQSQAEHVRLACEELGTVFIKLGQMLSTRGDLLPEAYRVELAKLENDVPPLPVDVIAAVIEQSLGTRPDQIFASFDPHPLGSASIGQVHSAQLHDGCAVVVKVLKPCVSELVRLDLEILADLANKWSSRLHILQQFDVKGLIQEFTDSLLAELNFRRETANEKFFAEVFASQRGFKIPKVIDEYSNDRVLTHERIDGTKSTHLDGVSKPRREAIAQRIARFLIKPAFERGTFYADPHPGNLLIQEDGALGVIDFGTVGHLTPDAKPSGRSCGDGNSGRPAAGPIRW